MGQTVNLLVNTFDGSNPSLPTIFFIAQKTPIHGCVLCALCGFKKKIPKKISPYFVSAKS
jgi:hypothetical protein